MSEPVSPLLRRFAFLCLFSLAFTVFMGKSYETSLQALDSTTHAMLALEVSSGGPLPVLPMRNFITNHRPDAVFNDHPFTLFYLVGKVMNLFGPSAWSARLLPALFSAGCVLLTALLGEAFFSTVCGIIAGLILLLSRDFVLIGSRFHLDTPMTFFILLSFLLWWKGWRSTSGVAVGLGLWMKSPVAFLLYPSILLSSLLTRSFDRRLLRALVVSGLLAVLVSASIWVLTGAIGGWGLVADYWSRQVWGTAVGGRGSGTNPSPGLGLELLLRHYLPWVALLPVVIFQIFRTRDFKKPAIAIPFTAVLILETVLSSIRFKHYWYFIPVFPFLALLIAGSFRKGLEKQAGRILSAVCSLGVMLPVFLLCFPVPLGPENFPGLRKFHPFIQSKGSASDRVLFIDGGQPFGTDLDSIYELSFYTGRSILQAKSCAEAEELIQKERPEWIILTRPDPGTCVPTAILQAYPAHFRFGSQHLFSRILPPSEVGDLTPLMLELRPPRRGQSDPPAHDLYFPR